MNMGCCAKRIHTPLNKTRALGTRGERIGSKKNISHMWALEDIKFSKEKEIMKKNLTWFTHFIESVIEYLLNTYQKK